MGSCESHEKASEHGNSSSTKTEMEDREEIIKKLAVGAGVFVAAWGISKLFGSTCESTSYERKKMKAPGRDYHIYRDEFERDPAAYFRGLRD